MLTGMFEGKSILLGVSGGIAAYKAAELVRLFVKAHARVQVVMTANARHFITPLTMQALSEQPVCTDLFDLGMESQIGHIHMARAAHLAVLAPATANLIAKVSAGIADDYLTTALLATTAPVLICPAMNVKMYENPVTRRNLMQIKELGYHLLDPESGELACKEEGAGRLADLGVIIETACRILTPQTLAGRRLLVSAGPTWEAFDPVRFISNPSTGKMGYALANVAARRGAEVYLVSGPTYLPPPIGVEVHKVTTALEMRDRIVGLAPDMDVTIMAAAVGDYRPEQAFDQKVKKVDGQFSVNLLKNPDILACLGRERREGQVLIGFAAETENLIENATDKLLRKNLDFIVANSLSESGSGFACDTNEVKIISRNGKLEELPRMTKEKVAEAILDRVDILLTRATAHENQ